MDGLDNLLSTLGVAFDAAVARDEDIAAGDLAVSLRHDRDLRDVLVRGGPWTVVLADGRRIGLDVVGADFVAGGAIVVPLGRAAVAATRAGAPPRPSSATFHQIMRGCARSRARVTVADGDREWSGRAVVCGRDYFSVACAVGDVLVSLASVAWVRVDGSDDAAW